jgi:hypothetical protein
LFSLISISDVLIWKVNGEIELPPFWNQAVL